MTPGVEKRLQPRVEIRWPVTVITTQAKIEGEMHNVSSSGAFISCKDALSLAGSFFIIIKPPDRQTMSVAGKAVWTTILETNEGSPSLGVGVQFTNMTRGDRDFLRRLLTSDYKKKSNSEP